MSDGDQYVNPDPLFSEAPVYVDNVKHTTAIDLGAQMSTISISFVKHLDLPIYHLNHILNMEAMGGGKVPYLGYVETHLQVPGVKTFNDDMLMLIFEYNPYRDWVLMQVETLHLNWIIYLISKDEIDALTRKWQLSRVGTLLANRSAILKADNVDSFDLSEVCGSDKTITFVEMSLFQTVHV